MKESELLQKINGTGFNSKDPLNNSAEVRQQSLIEKMSRVSDGYSAQDIIVVAMTMMIRCLRQCYPNKVAAGAKFTEHYNRAMQLLMDHYDGVNKRKQGLFPFNQTVSARIDLNKVKRYGQK